MSAALMVLGAVLVVVGAAFVAWQSGVMAAGVLLLLAGVDEARR